MTTKKWRLTDFMQRDLTLDKFGTFWRCRLRRSDELRMVYSDSIERTLLSSLIVRSEELEFWPEIYCMLQYFVIFTSILSRMAENWEIKDWAILRTSVFIIMWSFKKTAQHYGKTYENATGKLYFIFGRRDRKSKNQGLKYHADLCLISSYEVSK